MFPQIYAVLEVGWKQVLKQLESHTQTTDRRMESMEGDMQAMMGLLQTFIGSPQMIASISIGFIYLVDATGQKHPIPMNTASSFEVHLYISPEIIFIVINVQQFNDTLRALFQPINVQCKELKWYVDFGAYELVIYNGRKMLEITNQNVWASIECSTTIFMNICSTGTANLPRLMWVSCLP